MSATITLDYVAFRKLYVWGFSFSVSTQGKPILFCWTKKKYKRHIATNIDDRAPQWWYSDNRAILKYVTNSNGPILLETE